MLVHFVFGGMAFEYDPEKNKRNQKKHGIPLQYAARVFFDDDRIEFFDDRHSADEDRYDIIGSAFAGNLNVIGHLSGDGNGDILFVVYTERSVTGADGKRVDVTRLISARLATNFERGLYYGKSS